MFYKAAVNTELENIESLILGEDVVCGMGLRCELHPTPVLRGKEESAILWGGGVSLGLFRELCMLFWGDMGVVPS